MKMSQNISREQTSSPLLLEKDKSHHKLERCENKGESSVSAVAAIGSDKIAVNRSSSVSYPDAKSTGSADVRGIVEGHNICLLIFVTRDSCLFLSPSYS